ncbi:MAG: M17 family peptidase N-terminal domain-containing protein, partial [Candidatus Latescibacterota bacterium]
MTTTISLAAADITGREDVLILPVFKDSPALKGAAGRLDKLCNGAISVYLEQGNFKGDGGKIFLIAIHAPHAPKHVLLLGLGDRKKLDPDKIAHFAGNASLALKNHGLKSAHLLLDGASTGTARDTFVFYFIKGYLLAQYSFALKGEPDQDKEVTPALCIMCGKDRRRLDRVVKKAQIISLHTGKVRDMVNAPANTLTPAIMAREAKAIAKANGIDCKVMSLTEIEKRKMGAILSVAQGSREEAKLIVMQYNQERTRLPLVCLVGKGVTFDSGGISLKSWEKMNEMKGDMAGGALVINVLAAASNLKLPVRLV